MCLGFPGLVESLSLNVANVDIAGTKREVSTILIGDDNLKVGDWVMVHAGFAMSKMDEDEAKETLKFLLDVAAMEEAAELEEEMKNERK